MQNIALFRSTSCKTSASYELDQCDDRNVGTNAPERQAHLAVSLAAENQGS